MNATPITDPRPVAARRPMALVLPFDFVLAIAVAGIAICSLVTLNTVHDPSLGDGYYMKRQALYVAVGAVMAVVLSRVDYSRLRELKYGIYGFLIASILAVMAVGSTAKGARRAIQLPSFSFQASELGKVLLVVALSAFIVDRSRRLHDRRTTGQTMLFALIPAAMVMVQPDLGSSLVYIAIVLALLFFAGTPARHFLGLLALGAVAIALVLVAAPAVGHPVLHDYQTSRLTAFLHPTDNPSSKGYQQNQSRIAIGSGEKTGRGDKATQTSYNFLPEHHTDFIFAVVGERWGFMGAALVLSLYALLIWRALRILTVAKNLYGALVAGGIAAMMLFQVFVNVGMTIGIMPITGIPLPLMSYGGSSVITTLLAMGLLQSIYAHGRASNAGKGRVLGF
jgi:rod shape determining protein RodA